MASVPNAADRTIEDIFEGAGESTIELAHTASRHSSNDGAWDALEAWAGDAQAPDGVGALYRRQVAVAEHGLERDRLVARALRFHEEWYEEGASELLEVLRSALDVDALSDTAFQRLTVIFTSRERWNDLLDAYDARIATTAEPGARQALIEEALQTARDFANDDARSIVYLRRIVELDPGNVDNALTLERALERNSLWDELIPALCVRRDRSSGAEADTLRLRVARLEYEQRRRALPAVETARPLTSAVGEVRVGALALLDAIREDASAPVDARLAAIQALRTARTADGDSRLLVVLIESEMALSEGGARVRLAVEAGDRLVGLSEFEGALAHFTSAFRADPREDSVREKLKGVCNSLGRVDEYVQLLEAAAESAEPATASMLRGELAQVRATTLGDTDGAIAAYERLLEESSDAAARRSVCRTLAELHRTAGHAESTLAYLEREAEFSEPGDDKKKVLREAALLALELGLPDRALASWKARLEDDDGDRDAQDAVIEILEREGRHEELVVALRRRALRAASRSEERGDLEAVARIEAGPLANVAASIDTWRAIAARFGEDADVVDALTAAFEATSRASDLAELLERTESREGSHLAHVRARLGDVYRERLLQPHEAVAAYERALNSEPGHAPARSGLQHLAELTDMPEVSKRAVEALSRSYSATGDSEAELALVDARARFAGDDDARVSVLVRGATLAESRAGDAARAFELLAAALALNPGSLRLESELMRVASAGRDPSDVATALATAASRIIGDPTRRSELLVAASREAERAGSPPTAFEYAALAFELRPQDQTLAAHVAAIAPDDTCLARAMAVLAKAAEDPGIGLETLDLLVGLQRRLGDEGAALTLECIAERRPRDLDALFELVEIATASGDDAGIERAARRAWDRSAALIRGAQAASGHRTCADVARWALELVLTKLESRSALAEASRIAAEAARLFDSSLRLDLLRRADRIGEAASLDLETLIELRREIVRAAPTDAEAVATLADSLERTDRLAEVLQLRLAELARAVDPEHRLSVRLAVVDLVDRIDQATSRVEVLRANLAERPGHAPSIAAISELLRRERRTDELVDVLADQASKIGPPGSAAMWLRVARLSAHELGDERRARRAYEALVEIEPSIEAYDALADLAERRGDVAGSARWLERRLALCQPDEVGAVSLRLAAAQMAQGRRDRALEVLEAAFGETPADVALRERLLDLYRASGNDDALARVSAVAALAEHDPARRLELARDSARLYFHALGRPAEAIPMLELAAGISPEDKQVRVELADAYRHAGRAPDARRILETLVEEYGRRRTPERAQVHFELGRVLEELGEVDGAIEQLEQATQIAVSNAPMLLALGRLASRAGQTDRAEKTYRTLLMLVRRRAEGERVDVGVGEVLYELHSIALGRGDEAAKATELLDSAVEVVSGSDGEAVRFVDALIERKAPEIALRGIEARMALRGGERDVELTLRHARALEASGRMEDAVSAYLAAADSFPLDTRVHAAARAAATKAGHPLRYVEAVGVILERLRRGEDDALVASLSITQANCLEVDVGDFRAAATLYRALIASEGDDAARSARAGLARTLRAAGDTVEEREVQRAIREDVKASADERLEALYRIAEIDIVDPARRSGAVDALRAAVDEDGRAQRAARMLRDVVSESELDAPGWAIYESIARGAADSSTLVDYLFCRAERVGSSLQEVSEAVERATAAGQAQRGRSLLLRLASRADDMSAGEARSVFLTLAELDESLGDFSGALVWLARAAEVSEPDEAREIRLRIARAASQPGGDTELAVGAYRELVGENPNQPDLLMSWLALNARLADTAGVDEVVELSDRADLSVSERNGVRREAARYHASIKGGAQCAIELLRSVVDDDPQDSEAASMLEAIFEREGYDADRAGLLERRLDTLIDAGASEELVEVALRTAELHAKVDRAAASNILRRTLDVMPYARRVVEGLLALLEGDEDARERVELEERLIATEPTETIAAATLSVAEAWRALGDEDGVVRALMSGFERLGDDEVLRPRLEAIFRERGDDAGLVALLARRLDVVVDPLTRRAIALEAAAIERGRRGDPNAAAAILGRLLEGPFDLGAFDEYIACLVDAGRRDDAITAIGVSLDSVGVQDELRATLLAMRSDLRRTSGDLAFALADLDAITEPHRSRTLQPTVSLLRAIRDESAEQQDEARERYASLRLAQLHEDGGQVELARDVLAEHVDRHASDREAVEWLVRLQQTLGDFVGIRVSAEALVACTEGEARIAAALLYTDACEKTGRLERAREVLEHVRDTTHEDSRIVDRLRAIYLAMGEHREVAAMFLAEARVADDDRKFECLLEAGRILIEASNDPEAALEPLSEAIAMRPDDMAVAVTLVDAYLASDRLAEAGHLLEQSIANHPKRRTPELSQLQHRMGRYARASGDRDLELQWMVAALECDKNNVECAADLATVAMELGDHETALTALRTITLARTEGPISRALAYLLQAKIAHQRGESRRALLWARKAREVDATLEGVDAFLRELGENP